MKEGWPRGPFTVAMRDDVRARVLEMAAADGRVVAGAVVGSFAGGTDDRWSDLDLTFGLASGVSIEAVLDDWTATLSRETAATRLFDVTVGETIYRVFLLPGCLQLDLSFTPGPRFGARTPAFRLLFGKAADAAHVRPPSPLELLGQAVHHALRARVSIERGRLWQAEHWIRATRDVALSLACVRAGLPAPHGRGLDGLPATALEGWEEAGARAIEEKELRRALAATLEGLEREARASGVLEAPLDRALETLATRWDADGAT